MIHKEALNFVCHVEIYGPNSELEGLGNSVKVDLEELKICEICVL